MKPGPGQTRSGGDTVASRNGRAGRSVKTSTTSPETGEAAATKQRAAVLGKPGAAGPERPQQGRPQQGRPLPVAGIVAAVWTLGAGLATLSTLTLIGWIAAPHGAIADGLPGVFRVAAQLWLVAHHAGFAINQGWVGMLPLALTVLPGLLLYRAGLWMVRQSELPPRMLAARLARIRLIGQAAVALAAPYSLLSGGLALIARTEVAAPSMAGAMVNSFLIALVAGALAAVRILGPLRGLLRQLPARAHSLVAGTASALGILLFAGLLLVVVALILGAGEFGRLSGALAPGLVGGALLMLAQLLYLPNVSIWGMAYAIGPGFAVGTGTIVAPTGVQLGRIPTVPMLAALPEPGSAPWGMMLVLAVPFTAGVAGGVRLIRTAPAPTIEAAALWGFACGIVVGAVAGVLAALSGGPLGGDRLAEIGPSPWEVGLSCALEVGLAAAIAAGAMNWHVLRKPVKPETWEERAVAFQRYFAFAEDDTRPIPVITPDGVVDETDDRDGHKIYMDPYAWDRD